MKNINTRLDNFISNADNKILSKFHRIDSSGSFLIQSSSLAYTGLSVTVPANSYFCISAFLNRDESSAKIITISFEKDILSALSYNENTSGSSALSTTYCGITATTQPYFIWAQSTSQGINKIVVSGFYVN